jgi:hypothetical protein
MGNFSRNTFNPAKNYIGVRLQQGVPLVDADWNELNDVVRHELYNGLKLALPNGVTSRADLKIFNVPPDFENNIRTFGGTAIIEGRPIDVGIIIYSNQLWTNPTRAAQDGVAVIPPLTSPTAPRTDIAYLDVWEREVGSVEDSTIVNPVIGVETCVRLRREFALRVAEGTTTIPQAPTGHVFLPLALLRRPGGPLLLNSHIQDIRSLVYGLRGSREVSFIPTFWPYELANESYAWKLSSKSFAPRKMHAAKNPTTPAYGILPLGLPDGARLTHLRVSGNIEGAVEFNLYRFSNGYSETSEVLISDAIQPPGGAVVLTFDRTISIPDTDQKHIVDNSSYYYGLLARAHGIPSNYAARIDGVAVRYEY